MAKDFIFGTATASYQVEGTWNEDGGIGKSIWDTFCETDGKVYHKHNGSVACDQYHKYKEDVKLMKELGIDSYRFSIAWPRIFPESMDKMNTQGFDYYKRLIDELWKNNIKPCVTLYHWDLPQYLEDNGGWANRETAYMFQKFAIECFKALGDSVPMWITLNEALCASFLGYGNGAHAPGHTDMQKYFNAIHHLNMAHGLGVKAYREMETKYQYDGKGQIGITHNLGCARPATNCKADIEAADRVFDLGSRIYLNPNFGRKYPQRTLDAYKDVATMPIEDGDYEIMGQKIDFLGINYYQEGAVKYDENAREKFSGVLSYHDKTAMDWSITPMGLYRLLKWVKEEYSNKEYGDFPIYITENGCAANDVLAPEPVEERTVVSRCHDKDRIDYLQKHFAACKRAMDEGVNLKGYYLWSFMDNFEWAYGYAKRFGIVYIDYNDLRRIPKDSYYYYREFIAGNEEFSLR